MSEAVASSFEKGRPVATESRRHRHLTDVGRGAAVEHAHVVGGGAITHPRQPALEDRDVGVSGLGRAHLLPDMVLLDGPQPPLLVGGEEVLPERVTLRRPTRLCEGILLACQARTLLEIICATQPEQPADPGEMDWTVRITGVIIAMVKLEQLMKAVLRKNAISRRRIASIFSA